MDKKIQKRMAPVAVMFLLAGFLGAFASLSFSAKAFADDDAGVTGCTGVKVDPNASVDDQQAICGNAENYPSSSCAASGHGLCSAPKTDGTLVDGDHCVCLSQSTESAPAS